MDNFGRQKFNQMDNFVPQTHRQTDRQTHRQTDRHTDTLLIFISIDKPIGASPRGGWTVVVGFVGFVVL